MTLIFDKSTPGEAQTHAFLIGVGHYPHLPEGGGAPTSLDMGLGQLTSPPVSARALASWLIKKYNNPDANLGSLELFLSEKTPQLFENGEPGGKNVDPASMACIQPAFRQWIDRCKSHPKNVLFFYFCGHGALIGGNQILLLEDYGADDDAPFNGAIDFSRMWQAAANTVEGFKCFFADACSNVSDADVVEANAPAMLVRKSTNGDFNKRVLAVRGAVDGTSSYGKRNDVSRFTRVLIDCLAGRAANNVGGKWTVTNLGITQPLGIAMREINDFEIRKGGIEQVPLFDKFSLIPITLHVCNPLPEVPVVIEFDPEDAIAEAHLKLRSAVDPTWVRSREPAGEPGRWELREVSIGSYIFDAEFETPGRKKIESLEIRVIPPGPVPNGPFMIEEES
jgi:hypothetical protein